MNFDPNLRLKQQPDLVWREVDDGAVIVSPAGGEVRALNGLGSTIWQLLDGTNTAGDIVERLKDSYPAVDEAQLQADFTQFVDSLLTRDLLVPL